MAFLGSPQNQDPFGSTLRGFQGGQPLEQQRTTEDSPAAQAALQQTFARVVANPRRTAQDIFELAAMLPERQTRGFAAANKQLGDEGAKNLLTFGTQVLSAFNSGATDIGLELLEERAIAAENSGNQAEAQALRAWGEIAEINPDAAFTTVASQIATLPGGKAAIESILGTRQEGSVDAGQQADAPPDDTEVTAAATAAEPEPPIQEALPDITEALGFTGFSQDVLNNFIDFFGGNLPFEETSQAAALLDNLNNETLRVASSSIAGRPSVFFQEKINELLVPANSLFNSKGAAFNRFRALSQQFVSEADRLQSDIDNGQLRAVTVDKARTRISELLSLAAKYDQVIASGEQAEKPPLESFFRNGP